MNLEEEKGDKKPKGIAFQAESRDDKGVEHGDEDDDIVETMALMSKNFSKILKRFNKNNKGSARNRESSSGLTGGPTSRRNPTSNADNLNAGSRNRSGTGNNPQSNARNKGIQCHECEGIGHI